MPSIVFFVVIRRMIAIIEPTPIQIPEIAGGRIAAGTCSIACSNRSAAGSKRDKFARMVPLFSSPFELFIFPPLGNSCLKGSKKKRFLHLPIFVLTKSGIHKAANIP